MDYSARLGLDIESYEHFLKKYPNTEYTNAAEQKINELRKIQKRLIAEKRAEEKSR